MVESRIKFPTLNEGAQQTVRQLIADAVPGERTIIGYGGSKGAGKSHVLAALGIELSLDFPGNRILIARDQLASLKESTLEIFDRMTREMEENFIDPATGERAEIVVRRNDYHMFRDLRMPWWPRGLYSRVMFKAVHDYEQLKSIEFGAILLDECSEIPSGAPTTLLACLRWHLPESVKVPLKHVMVCTSNPFPGWFKDWFIDGELSTEKLQEMGAGSAHFVPAKLSDNPILGAQYEAVLRATLSPADIRRFVEGEWDSFEGRVFEIDPRIHRVDLKQHPNFLDTLRGQYDEVIGGLDFGGLKTDAHFSTGSVSVILRNGVEVVVSVFKDRGPGVHDRQLAWMIGQNERWAHREGISNIVWYADRTQPVGISHMRGKGAGVIKTNDGTHDEREDNIRVIQEKLMVRKMPGTRLAIPKLIWTSDCMELEAEMKEYAWMEREVGGVIKRVPRRVNDDLIDTEQYKQVHFRKKLADPADRFAGVLGDTVNADPYAELKKWKVA